MKQTKFTLNNKVNSELEDFPIKEEKPQSEQIKAPSAESKTSGNFSRHMVGSYIDPMNGDWMVASIAFNPATLQLGEIKTERVAGDIQVMRERLQIKQANLGLIEAGSFFEERKTEIY